MSNAITAYMLRSERAVSASGIPWTAVRPFGFMSNALGWAGPIREERPVRAAFAGVRVAVVDPFDIAGVAVAALTGDGHEGRTYVVTGPESTTPGERAAVLGRVLGREIRFEAQPDAEARAEMERSMPKEYVDAFFGFYVEGSLDESAVLPTVATVTGRPPRTFEAWATAHADAFR